MQDILLDVKGLVKDFPVMKKLTRQRTGTLRAVNDVSFSIRRGETLGLVGESGCGKTTVGRCILRAIEPTEGKVFYNEDGNGPADIVLADASTIKRLRKRMRIIFQDPYSSLNPRMTVRQIVGEPLIANGIAHARKEVDRKVAEVLAEVGLDPKYMNRYPHAFSGGQRQRIAIARTLVLRPEFVIADEPVSALDVSIQAQILNLLQKLKAEFNLTYLFIAHNLAIIQHMSDSVAVMYMGRIMEKADTDDLFDHPLHPYTEALLSSVPIADPNLRKRKAILKGEIGNLRNPPEGCFFHPRCSYATDICAREVPQLLDAGKNPDQPHSVACHLSQQLSLQGLEG